MLFKCYKRQKRPYTLIKGLIHQEDRTTKHTEKWRPRIQEAKIKRTEGGNGRFYNNSWKHFHKWVE